MEKILTNKQTDKTRIEIVKLEKMCEKLNDKFIPQFNELGICEITLELLQDAFFNKSAKIIELVNQQAEPEIKKAKNAAIKAMFKNAVQAQIDEFLASTRLSIDYELFQYITVSNGAIEPVEGYKESIEKSNYYYIETEQEKAIHDALMKIADGINEFNYSLGENAKRLFHRNEDFFKFLTSTKNGVIEMDLDTDFKFLAK